MLFGGGFQGLFYRVNCLSDYEEYSEEKQRFLFNMLRNDITILTPYARPRKDSYNTFLSPDEAYAWLLNALCYVTPDLAIGFSAGSLQIALNIDKLFNSEVKIILLSYANPINVTIKPWLNPTLLVSGIDDPYLKYAEDLASKLPNVTFEKIQSGHDVFISDDLIPIILKWLEKKGKEKKG